MLRGPLLTGSLCFQDGGTRKLERAKISLDDCLACSGCVTSAETVLITQQSHEELRKILDANKVSGGQSLTQHQPQHPSFMLSRTAPLLELFVLRLQ